MDKSNEGPTIEVQNVIPKTTFRSKWEPVEFDRLWLRDSVLAYRDGDYVISN